MIVVFYLLSCTAIMKRAAVERSIVVVLFITVLVLFTIADKDSKKLERLYTYAAKTIGRLTAFVDVSKQGK